LSVVSAVRNLCQEWTQIASNDERDLLRLRSPTPGNPAPTVMGHYCLQNAARRVHGSAPEHPPARLPLPLPCPCIQDLPRPDSSPTHGFTPAARQATRLPIPCSHCPPLAPSPAPAAAAAPAPAAPAPPARASMSQTNHCGTLRRSDLAARPHRQPCPPLPAWNQDNCCPQRRSQS